MVTSKGSRYLHCRRSVLLACGFHGSVSPAQSDGDTHLSLSGAVMWAQLWILLCHSNAVSNMFLHFNSQCFFPSSHSKDYALTFLKLPLNFNSCSQPTRQLTCKEASQFPSKLPFPSKMGKSEEGLKKNY